MIKLDFSKQIGKKIPIKEKTKVLYFDVELVRYIICDRHYCYIYFLSETKGYRTLHPLKYFEEELKDVGFRRINHNTLVNAQYISDAHLSRTQKTLHLMGGKDGKIEPHIISKRRVRSFRE